MPGGHQDDGHLGGSAPRQGRQGAGEPRIDIQGPLLKIYVGGHSTLCTYLDEHTRAH